MIYLNLIMRSGIQQQIIDSKKMPNNSMMLDKLCAPNPNAVRLIQKSPGKKMILSFFIIFIAAIDLFVIW